VSIVGYRLTPKGVIFTDHDTGDYIIIFFRRGRIYAFLRDRITNKWKKKLDTIYIQYIGVIEKCYEHGVRKGKGSSRANNLHAECHKCKPIQLEGIETREEILEEIELAINDTKEDCGYNCFGEFGLDPDRETWIVRSLECYNECYYDRCESVATI